jgi:predicted dehydrogenase
MHPAIRRARQLVAAGEIGEVFLGQVTAVLSAPQESAPPDTLLEAAFHAVSVLQRFLGPAHTVTAERSPDREKPSAGGAVLRHSHGALSTLTLSQASEIRAVQERRLVGTRGMLLIRDDPEDELPLVGLRGEEVIPLPVRVPLRVHPWNVSRMVDHFVDCLRTGQDPEVTLDEARAALATVLALRESAASGRRVTVAGPPR